MQPLVSVLIPTFNNGHHLREAVDSILSQTYTNFELIIINDGSTDDTAATLQSYSDPRIRVITQAQNSGRPYARNRALAEAKGEYIFWMDGDDISLPNRLEKQITFMNSHPEFAVCGGTVQCFSGSSARINYTPNHADIHTRLFLGPSISNPASCIRRSYIEKHAIRYNENFSHRMRSEDYDFWCQMILGHGLKATNIPDLLLFYRFQISVDKASHREVLRLILPRLGLAATEELLQTYLEFSLPSIGQMTFPVDAYMNFAATVIAANKQKKIFNQRRFKNLIYSQMLLIVRCFVSNYIELFSSCVRLLGPKHAIRGFMTLFFRKYLTMGNLNGIL